MSSEITHIDPRDPELGAKIENIQRVPGLCIFIDITGSTQMKCSDLKEWVAKIYNRFSNGGAFLQRFAPIKSIGDALMYYIESYELLEKGYSLLQIYDGLWQIAAETGPEFPDVKIGAAWCEEVYAITSQAGARDYYGIDIDLAARLQAIADSKEAVIDFRFHEKILGNYNSIGNQSQFVSVRRLVGPEEVSLKGIPQKVLIYRGC
jgi:class 3 adenylate cyclase